MGHEVLVAHEVCPVAALAPARQELAQQGALEPEQLLVAETLIEALKPGYPALPRVQIEHRANPVAKVPDENDLATVGVQLSDRPWIASGPALLSEVARNGAVLRPRDLCVERIASALAKPGQGLQVVPSE